MFSITDLPSVLDQEVDPRLRSAGVWIEQAIGGEPSDYGLAIDAAIRVLITARGWLTVSKAMES